MKPVTDPAPPQTMLKPKASNPKPNSDGTHNSWADKVRVSDSSTRFTLEPLSRQPVGCNLKITEAMLLDNSEQWNRCMIGFFPGFRMPFHAVNSIASRAWRSYGLENVTTTANGFMIFRFKTEDELHTVLEKGPWMFGGKNIILQQWHPRFQFDKNKITTLPVWVRLHGLPFPLWSKQGLSLAASMVGRPFLCDELTYNCTRLEYARLCVEVDATLPFVHRFEIESPLSAAPLVVTVDYEWKPSRCEKCNVFGHCCPTSTEDKGKGKAHDDPPAVPTQLQPDPQPTIITSTKVATQSPADKPPIIMAPTQSSPQPHVKPLPDPIIMPADPADIDDCDSSQDSGNEFLDLQHHHLTTMHASLCLESKMDSLRTASANSSAAQEVSAEASSSSIPHNFIQSPSPPTTVRKKKGGRKKKEARGH